MLAHIVTAANRHSYVALLDEMHRQRHEVFVLNKGWLDLTCADARERDEFDRDDVTYLLVVNDVGELEGSVRLTPSLSPHLLQAKAADWNIAHVPTGFGVWEWSRYLPGSPGASRQRLADCRAVLLTSALEFALSRGITTYTALCDVKRFHVFTEMGWQLEFLSGVVDYGQGRAAAIKWAVGQAELDHARERFGFKRPVSMELPSMPSREPFHYLQFAIASELWELDDPMRLSDALFDLSRHATMAGLNPNRRNPLKSSIIVPEILGRA
jgi:N-acyl-L-homoserine lactone synthetase